MHIRNAYSMPSGYRAAALSTSRRIAARPSYSQPRQYRQKPKPMPAPCCQWRVDPTEPLLVEISRFLEHFDMAPSRFGHYHHDKRLVFDLVNGRKPTERVEKRIRDFMKRFEG